MLENKIRCSNHFNKQLKEEGESKVVSFLNPFSYYLLKDSIYLDGIDYLYIDGASLVYSYNLFSDNKVDRVSFDFSSIATDVIEFANENDKSILFVGGEKSESERAKKNFKKMFPDTRVNVKDGYSSLDSLNVELDESDIIVIGMGCPLQDRIAVDIKNRYPSNKKIFTCGGFISQTAQKGDYYHPLVKKFGLRWLQRFILHGHVRKRLAVDYPRFFIRYFYEKTFKKSNS